MASRTLRRLAFVVLGLTIAVIAVFAFLIGDDEVDEAPASSFYETPGDIRRAEPGEVLRTEPLGRDPEGADAIRLLYATRSDPGRPVRAASAVVFVPEDESEDEGAERKVVAWAHPTTGIASSCAPSLDPDGGAALVPGLEGFIDDGHVVVAPDYPGLGTEGIHPYLVGVSEGRSILDAARAAATMPEAGAGPELALWGHSQGGQAALFAAQLQPAYAPGLELRGTAVAAPAAELRELLKLDLPISTGKILGSIAAVSWAAYYPKATLRQIVPPAVVPVLKGIAKRCLVTKSEFFADLTLAASLRKFGVLTFADVSQPPWSSIIARNTPASDGQPAPVFVGQGTEDAVVAPQTTERFVRRLCAAGIDVRLRVNDGGDHFFGGFDSAPGAVKWIDERLDGKPPRSNCAKPPP